MWPTARSSPRYPWRSRSRRPIEKPRPSPNFGKLTSTRAAPPRRAANAAGSSVGSSRSTWSLDESGLSVTTRRPLIRVAIDAFLERLDADALHDVDESLGIAVALLEVALDELLDHVGHVGPGKRRAEDFSKRRRRLVAADLDLVPLLAVLIQAEDADVADVVVAAGVHAARDVEVELADLVQVVQIVEALLDRLRHRDRLGVRQRAEVAARAGDDVGEQTDVRRREAQRARLAPQHLQIALA